MVVNHVILLSYLKKVWQAPVLQKFYIDIITRNGPGPGMDLDTGS